MVDEEFIQRWVRRVRHEVPDGVVVFLVGNYARGDAGPHSDLDLDVLVARPRAPPGTATRIWPACSGRPPRPPAGPTPSWASATGASPAAAAPSGPSWRSAATVLIIIWHLLADPDARFQDLGPGFSHTPINPERAKRNHIRQLEALGDKVTLQPAA